MHDCGLNTWKILLASNKANATKICKYLTIKINKKIGENTFVRLLSDFVVPKLCSCLFVASY